MFFSNINIYIDIDIYIYIWFDSISGYPLNTPKIQLQLSLKNQAMPTVSRPETSWLTGEALGMLPGMAAFRATTLILWMANLRTIGLFTYVSLNEAETYGNKNLFRRGLC